MVTLRPNQLPAATTPLGPSDLLVVDQGAGGVNAAVPQDIVDAAAPVVSQANAEAGINNNDRMTALRTKQSIASEVGVTLASKAQGDLASTAVQPTRQILAGDGLTGGGALSADVTVNVGAGTGISVTANAVGLDAGTQSRLLIGGGTTSQVLQKASNTDYDVAWATVAAATAVSYAPQTLTGGEQLQARTNIGLSNVNNTSDANKPVSTATQNALNLKQDTLTAGSVTNSLLSNMVQATVKGRASGAGTGAPTDLDASALFTILGGLVPAKPQTASGVGQFLYVETATGAGYTLPAGGTWAWVLVRFTSGGLITAGASGGGVAAGGTTVLSALAGNFLVGFVWRIA